MSTCQCGGIIRQQGVPFFDILRSCSCASPVAVAPTHTIITTTTSTNKRNGE